MSIEEAIVELKKVVPESQFRKEPEHARNALLALEAKHNLNTVDFLNRTRIEELDEDTQFDWLNEYETYLLFKGKDKDINSITDKKE